MNFHNAHLYTLQSLHFDIEVFSNCTDRFGDLLIISSNPVPQSSAPAMISKRADLSKPFGTVWPTSLRSTSAIIHVNNTYPVDTAIHGTNPISTLPLSSLRTESKNRVFARFPIHIIE